MLGCAAISMCGLLSHDRAQLTIAAASNLRPVMPKLISLYISSVSRSAAEKKPVVIYGSSGKLAAQIQNGAPFDVFVSADEKYSQRLALEGLTSKPKIYAFGRLVLWVSSRLKPYSTETKPLPVQLLTRLVVPNPDLAPYGQAAVEWLASSGYWPQVRSKVVSAENVSLAANYIRTGTVDAGITARSLIKQSELEPDKGESNVSGHWLLIPENAHRPIAQSVVRLKSAGGPAKLFVQTLLSKEARLILEEHGYTVPRSGS